MPFGFGSNTTFGAHGDGDWGADIGLRIHFTEMVALQPSLSFVTRGERGNNDDGRTAMGINMDLLFYLFESNSIRQYLGGNFGFNVVSGNDDGDFRVGGIYGLQHEITSAIDVFGQVGLGMRFEPSRLYTVNTQLGVIFYLSK